MQFSCSLFVLAVLLVFGSGLVKAEHCRLYDTKTYSCPVWHWLPHKSHPFRRCREKIDVQCPKQLQGDDEPLCIYITNGKSVEALVDCVNFGSPQHFDYDLLQTRCTTAQKLHATYTICSPRTSSNVFSSCHPQRTYRGHLGVKMDESPHLLTKPNTDTQNLRRCLGNANCRCQSKGLQGYFYKYLPRLTTTTTTATSTTTTQRPTTTKKTTTATTMTTTEQTTLAHTTTAVRMNISSVPKSTTFTVTTTLHKLSDPSNTSNSENFTTSQSVQPNIFTNKFSEKPGTEKPTKLSFETSTAESELGARGQRTNSESSASSPVVAILISLFLVLLVGLIILGVVLFMLRKRRADRRMQQARSDTEKTEASSTTTKRAKRKWSMDSKMSPSASNPKNENKH